MVERSPEERAAAAQKLRDEGDSRPLSQIEAEMLAQEQQDAANPQRDDAAGKKAKDGE